MWSGNKYDKKIEEENEIETQLSTQREDVIGWLTKTYFDVIYIKPHHLCLLKINSLNKFPRKRTIEQIEIRDKIQLPS